MIITSYNLMKKLLNTLAILFLCITLQAQTMHPWQGKKVGYIGDSITDPNCLTDVRKYWDFLQEWLQITPYVYGISGREWNDVTRQVEQLNAEHGQDVDAILVFLGTNDFNSGVPIGEWYTETDEQVWAATGQPKELVTRKHRTPVFSNDTFKGRINIGIQRMKQLYPDKQIILLTPLHRAYAIFGNSNVQPDERYQNKGGEYLDAYVDAIKEAGNVWSVPVIDLHAISGLNPMLENQLPYFQNQETDQLHPNTKGHVRIAQTLMQQLLMYPCSFE